MVYATQFMMLLGMVYDIGFTTVVGDKHHILYLCIGLREDLRGTPGNRWVFDYPTGRTWFVTLVIVVPRSLAYPISG